MDIDAQASPTWFEEEPTNPLEGFGIISKQEWDDAQAEITRLKEQLARTERIIEQADLKNRFDVIQDKIYENYQDGDYYADKEKCPDLYAHLAGEVDG